MMLVYNKNIINRYHTLWGKIIMIIRSVGTIDSKIEKKINKLKFRNKFLDYFLVSFEIVIKMFFFLLIIFILSKFVEKIRGHLSFDVNENFSLALMQMQGVVSALSISVLAYITITHNQRYYGYFLSDFLINIKGKIINIKTIILTCLMMIIINPILVLERKSDLFISVFILTTILIIIMLNSVLSAISSSKKNKDEVANYSKFIIKNYSNKLFLNKKEIEIARTNIELASLSNYFTYKYLIKIEQFICDFFDDINQKLNTKNYIGLSESFDLIKDVYYLFEFTEYNPLKDYVFDLFQQYTQDALYFSRIVQPNSTYDLIRYVNSTINLRAYNNVYKKSTELVLIRTDLKYSIDAWIDNYLSSISFSKIDIIKLFNLMIEASDRIILKLLFSKDTDLKSLESFIHTVKIVEKHINDNKRIIDTQRYEINDFIMRLFKYYKGDSSVLNDYKYSKQIIQLFNLDHYLNNIKNNGKFDQSTIMRIEENSKIIKENLCVFFNEQCI